MEETLLLYDSETCAKVGEAEEDGQDVAFPEFVDGWPDVLDCRHPPYTDQSLDENCHVAAHVRKPYILVETSQVEDPEPS